MFEFLRLQQSCPLACKLCSSRQTVYKLYYKKQGQLLIVGCTAQRTRLSDKYIVPNESYNLVTAAELIINLLL